MVRKLFTVLLLLLAVTSTHAHKSCCKKHLKQYIEDPNGIPPHEYQGQYQQIPDPDPSNVRPAGWDDDDDGPWLPLMMDNPEFAWKPPLIKNPNYDPPPFREQLYIEIEKAIPWVVLGVLITSILNAAQLPLFSLKNLLRDAGSPLFGSLIGLATPLCSCGALPVASGFVRGGVPLGIVVAFLTATQSAGLDSAAITWGLLGPMVALCRLAGVIVLSVAAGYAVPKGMVSVSGDNVAVKEAGGASSAEKPNRNVVISVCSSAVKTATDVFPTVLLGLALSTAATHSLPWLGNVYQHSEYLSPSTTTTTTTAAVALRSFFMRVAVLVAALPLQLCEHTTVTYAAAIQKAGGSPGLAFAFLLSAPATNIPSMLLLLKARQQQKQSISNQHTTNTTAIRVAIALTTTSLVLSYMVDAMGVDLLVENDAKKGGGMPSLPDWYIDISPYLAALLSVAALVTIVRGALKQKRCSTDDCCGEGTNHSKPKLE